MTDLDRDEIIVRLHQVKEVLEAQRSTKLERKFALLHLIEILRVIESA